MTAVWIVVAIIVALLLYLILSYNKLVRLRNEVDQGFSSIDVQLKRRADLIPNLVESVKALRRARARASSRRSPRRARPRSPPTTLPAKAARRRAHAVGASPACSASPRRTRSCAPSRASRPLQDELSDTENKIAAARRYYNNVVQPLQHGAADVADEPDRRRHSASRRASSTGIEDDADREPVAVTFDP